MNDAFEVQGALSPAENLSTDLPIPGDVDTRADFSEPAEVLLDDNSAPAADVAPELPF